MVASLERLFPPCGGAGEDVGLVVFVGTGIDRVGERANIEAR